jgi:hypothetical protein
MKQDQQMTTLLSRVCIFGGRPKIFSLLHNIWTGFEAHTASHSVSARDTLTVGKVAEA